MLADRLWDAKEEEDEANLPPQASTKKKSAWGDDDKEQFDLKDLSRPIDDDDRKAQERELEKEQRKKDKEAEKELKKLRKELKKEKKHKKDKGEAGASKEDDVWVEKPVEAPAPKPTGATEKHDDWLASGEAGFDSLISQGQRRDKGHEREEKRKAAQLEIDQKRYANELNPFLSGKATPETYQKVEVKTVGDGGASWRARLQKRQEEAPKKADEAPKSVTSAPPPVAVPEKYQVSGGVKMQRPGEQRPAEPPAARAASAEHSARDGVKDGGGATKEGAVVPTIAEAQKSEYADLDANHITALAIKARLLGDKEGYQRILKALSEREVVVIVPTTDPRLKAMEVAHQKAIDHRSDNKLPQPDQTKRRRKEKGEHEDVDLATMVAREKAEGGREYVQSLAENIVRNVGLMDDTNEWGDAALYDTKRKKRAEQSSEQLRHRAVAEHKRQENIADSCWFCYENPRIEKHLIVALGNHVYLAVPKRGTLLEGHCLLIPMTHTISMTNAEEEIEIEMKMFRKSLIHMFAQQKKVPVFMETVPNLKRNRHTFVECVPLPAPVISVAKGYFKKAINEAENEFETQNRKLIDLTGRGVKKAIPKQLPYFAVEFGSNDVPTGFGHVIEESSEFPAYFGREVLGGLLDLPPDVWRHPKDDSPDKQRERTKNFVTAYHAFDWTRQLE